MVWFWKTEREKWAVPFTYARPQPFIGLPALDPRSRDLYENVLPRGVPMPRFVPDRPPLNKWMAAHELMQHTYRPGQIVLGKFGGKFLGHLDDRLMVTIAGARAGKTSTVLEPNLVLYPGSLICLDPKGELASAARLRRALGHLVYVLDPFGVSGEASACFNVLEELDLKSRTLIDDVGSITHVLVIDDGDAKAKHWIDSARALLKGIALLTLTLARSEHNLVTVRQLLTLTYPPFVEALRLKAAQAERKDEKYYDENKHGVETLLREMVRRDKDYNGIMAGIGNRFLSMPPYERGSVFSTAAVQCDFLDSLCLREMSVRSDFHLSALRGDRPCSIFLCLPVGRMESHSRWLRMIVQMTCTVLERMGIYPRDRAPILFLLEEFATLGHMEVMERAAAYFPGFGIKLWIILQSLEQLKRYYPASSEIFLGNAGLVQCFANGDPLTLEFIAERLQRLSAPFELRTAFSRKSFRQLLLMEGEAPAAALRLDHEDVADIRAAAEEWLFQ